MKEAKDAIRILVALVFITLAAMASVDKETQVEVTEPQQLSQSEKTENSPSPSWASLLLEVLQRIV